MYLFVLIVIALLSTFVAVIASVVGLVVGDDNPFYKVFAGCSAFVVVIATLLSVMFMIGNEKIVVSEGTEKVSYSLIQSGRNFIEKNDGIYTFSYLDENNGEVTVTAEVSDSNLVYDLQQEKPYVTIYETTKIQYPKWWFIRGQDENEITYKYDIHLPIN